MTALAERFRSAAGRIPPVARDLLIAVAMVLAAWGVAYVLYRLGDRRLSMVFLMPVLFSGVAGGLRAGLVAAALSYFIYDFFFVPPLYSLFTARAQDAISLVVFATAAVVTGLGSGALRDEQRRAAVRSQTILTLLETSNFFTITPNETAIRQRLAEGVTAIVGTGAVVTDADGTVATRAGQGGDWIGGLEGELSSLARAAMRQERGILARGRFCARAARTHSAVVGAAVWLGPIARSRGAREQEEHVCMLVDLAAAAIGRGRRELQTQAPASSQDG